MQNLISRLSDIPTLPKVNHNWEFEPDWAYDSEWNQSGLKWDLAFEVVRLTRSAGLLIDYMDSIKESRLNYLIDLVRAVNNANPSEVPATLCLRTNPFHRHFMYGREGGTGDIQSISLLTGYRGAFHSVHNDVGIFRPVEGFEPPSDPVFGNHYYSRWNRETKTVVTVENPSDDRSGYWAELDHLRWNLEKVEDVLSANNASHPGEEVSVGYIMLNMERLDCVGSYHLWRTNITYSPDSVWPVRFSTLNYHNSPEELTLFFCTTEHISSPDTEPGVGVDWETVWEIPDWDDSKYVNIRDWNIGCSYVMNDTHGICLDVFPGVSFGDFYSGCHIDSANKELPQHSYFTVNLPVGTSYFNPQSLSAFLYHPTAIQDDFTHWIIKESVRLSDANYGGIPIDCWIQLGGGYNAWNRQKEKNIDHFRHYYFRYDLKYSYDLGRLLNRTEDTEGDGYGFERIRHPLFWPSAFGYDHIVQFGDHFIQYCRGAHNLGLEHH